MATVEFMRGLFRKAPAVLVDQVEWEQEEVGNGIYFSLLPGGNARISFQLQYLGAGADGCAVTTGVCEGSFDLTAQGLSYLLEYCGAEKVEGLQAISLCRIMPHAVFLYPDQIITKPAPEYQEFQRTLRFRWNAFEGDHALEYWLDIPGEAGYQASNLARVRSKNLPSKKLRQCYNQGGKMTMWGMGYVSRLVAKAFLPSDQKFKTIWHLDGEMLNSRPENLEWRQQFGVKNQPQGSRKASEQVSKGKLNWEVVQLIDTNLQAGAAVTQIAAHLGFAEAVVKLVENGTVWGYRTGRATVPKGAGKRKTKKFTPADEAEVNQSRAGGEPISSIAKRYAVSPTAIRKLLGLV